MFENRTARIRAFGEVSGFALIAIGIFVLFAAFAGFDPHTGLGDWLAAAAICDILLAIAWWMP